MSFCEIFKKDKLIARVATGKMIGLLIGLCAFFTLPIMVPDASLMLRWGLLLWYTTFGAIIGVFGVITRCPITKIHFTWWFRDAFVGAWLNFVLVFFAHDDMQHVLTAVMGEDGFMQSPFWFALEGAIFGLLIGYFAKRCGGEGKELLA